MISVTAIVIVSFLENLISGREFSPRVKWLWIEQKTTYKLSIFFLKELVLHSFR